MELEPIVPSVLEGKVDTEDDRSSAIPTHPCRCPRRRVWVLGIAKGGSLGSMGDNVQRREVRG